MATMSLALTAWVFSTFACVPSRLADITIYWVSSSEGADCSTSDPKSRSDVMRTWPPASMTLHAIVAPLLGCEEARRSP
jgi:hypothetical protein